MKLLTTYKIEDGPNLLPSIQEHFSRWTKGQETPSTAILKTNSQLSLPLEILIQKLQITVVYSSNVNFI
jgi:hypothetical protein